jgi:glycosyltransferase involved in cell wall biosynthesis
MSAATPGPTTRVSIGLPIRNGERTVEAVAKAVLAQDHEALELVIGDNASTDGTEELCRALARDDDRVVYLRRAQNIGLIPNFLDLLTTARGTYFRWIGDGDWIAPGYVTRCLAAFAEDERRLLVSTQLDYELADGTTTSADYRGTALTSPDPAERFAEMLRLLTTGFAALDPLYSMVHRERAAAVPFRTMLRGDEVFAARLALAGHWAHIRERLARRGWAQDSLTRVAARLDVPRWHAPLASPIQLRELVRAVAETSLTPDQTRRAHAAIARLALVRTGHFAERGARKAVRITRPAVTSTDRTTTTSVGNHQPR